MSRRASTWQRVSALAGAQPLAWVLLALWAVAGPFLAARVLGRGPDPLASRLLEPGPAWLVSLGDLAVALLLARALLLPTGALRSLSRLPQARWIRRLRPLATYAGGVLLLAALRGAALASEAPAGLGSEALLDSLRAAPGLLILWALAWSAAAAGLPGAFALWALLALSFLLREGWQPPLVRSLEPGLLWLGVALWSAPLGARVGPWIEREAQAWRGLPLVNLVRWTGRCVVLCAALVIGLGVLRLEAGQDGEERWVQLSTPTGPLRYRVDEAAQALSLAASGPRLRAALDAELPLPAGSPEQTLALDLERAVLREGELGLARRLAALRVERLLGPLAEAPPLASLAEGAAAHLGLQVSGADPFWYRWQVGVYWARGKLSPESLWDRRVLEEAGAEELGPALGEAACAVLRRRLGPGALPRVFEAWQSEAAARGSWGGSQSCQEAWARVLAPLELTPAQLWEGVVSLVLEAREDPRARFALPRLRASIAAEDDPVGWMIYAEPELELPPGWQIDCRVRWESGGEAWRLQPSGLAGDAQTFFLRSRELRRPPRVQLGVTNPSLPGPPTTGAVWEDWVEWRLQGE